MPQLCIIPARALKDDALTGSDLRALLAVGHFTNRDGSGVWAANATMAEVANLDDRHFRRSLAVLVERGYVRKLERPGTTSVLAVILDDPFPGEGEIRPGGRAKSAPPGRAESAPQSTPLPTPRNDSSSPSPAKSVHDELLHEHHRVAYRAVISAVPAARHSIDYELRLVAEGNERPGAGKVQAEGWARVGEALHQLVVHGRQFSARNLRTHLDGLDPLPTLPDTKKEQRRRADDFGAALERMKREAPGE